MVEWQRDKSKQGWGIVMEISLLLVGYLVLGVIFGIFCSYLADKKGHGGCAWFMLGFLFSFLALLVLIGLPSEREASREQGSTPGQPTDSTGSPSPSPQPRNFRLCPHCIQEVHELATACPHCQRDLPEVERCSYAACGRIINPTDDRCEDDEGNPFCDASHREVEYCYYGDCGKVIESAIDNRCADDEGNPFCSEWHRDSDRHGMQQEHSGGEFKIVMIIVLVLAAVLLLLVLISGG